jgi:TolB-like protein/class 3 adenylate cyclase/cytochrome c-type biogenesis protein CcmH/NrfG
VTSEAPERRLLAILSGDVAGYSRLMADDEDATVRTLRAWREQVAGLVTEHRGQLADFTGDNFLASFGTARDAVECALDIQRVLEARNAPLPEARRMRFRIGAHLGDVQIEGDRLFGDGVNVAARLQPLAQPGGLCLSAAMLEQVQGKLEIAVEDLGDQGLKNLPAPVRAFRAWSGDAKAAAAPRSSSRLRPVFMGAAVLVLLGLGLWAAWPRIVGAGLDVAGLLPSESPALPDKPSIAVLPFTNMSDEPEQEYFADGISEDITTALARTSTLFVISRNSAFTYKGKTFKIEDVGRELGVRYVLEGSVRRAGERVRVTAQLIDAGTGHHVWSDRYDRGLEDIFAVQSEITEQILAAVGATISDAELERIRKKPTESLTAYDAWSRGFYEFQGFRVESFAEARRWYERAIEIDPGFAAAVTGLASTYSVLYGALIDLDPANLDRAEELAQRAVELDPSFPLAHVTLGVLEIWRGRPEAARTRLERARELAPNDPASYGFLSLVALQSGDPLEALESFRTMLRLSPRYESAGQASMMLAQIYAQTGRPDEAEALWRRARESNPDLVLARLWLAAHLEGTGRHAEAGEVIAEALRTNPDLNVGALASHVLIANRPDSDAFLARLRAAGLP